MDEILWLTLLQMFDRFPADVMCVLLGILQPGEVLVVHAVCKSTLLDPVAWDQDLKNRMIRHSAGINSVPHTQRLIMAGADPTIAREGALIHDHDLMFIWLNSLLPGHFSTQLLHDAVDAGSLNVSMVLFHQVRPPDSIGTKLLSLAARRGRNDILSYLIRSGVEPTIDVMFYAVRQRDISVFCALLDTGIHMVPFLDDILVADTPCMLTRLAQAGAIDFTYADDDTLFYLASCGRCDTLRICLESGLDPESAGMLTAAALHGQMETLRLLLSTGIRSQGAIVAALNAAALTNKLDATHLLLEYSKLKQTASSQH